MHILKIIHGYPPDYNAGSEVYSQSIATTLAKMQQKVSVFTREENPYASDFSLKKQSINDNLSIYYINNPRQKDGYRHEKFDARFFDLIQELKPDVAHIGHLNHLSTGMVDILKQAKIPIIFTLHDFWLMCPRGQFLTRSLGQNQAYQPCSGQENRKCAQQCYAVYFSGRSEDQARDLDYWENWVKTRMEETKTLAKKVDLFLAPSAYLRERFIRNFEIPEHKIQYLSYGFPLDYLQAPPPRPQNAPFRFGYIGTHIPAKGINLLIEAFAALNKQAELWIWGHKDDQSSKALKNMAQNLMLNIEFKGPYTNKNLVDKVFSKIDCIVVPSIWAENAPLVIHEAQACQIPVITANFGGMAEYVQDGLNGLLFEHRNPQSLSQKMQFALENPELMRQLGQRGYLKDPQGRVPELKNHCQILLNLYTNLIQHDKQTPTLAHNA